ncbi:MAG TPA: hypothetical protein EYQ21_01025 [Flavobacteriales bacterium]|jgi:hypothetical protein|nr:hypothetical protein [Flavobacteriales bacterium]
MSKLLAGMVLILAIGFGVYYWLTARTIRVLTENNAELMIVTQTNQNTIDQLKNDSVRFEQLNTEMAVNLQRAEEYGDRLSRTLREHNLTRLTLQRPGLIETRVNNATAQILSDIESITAN